MHPARYIALFTLLLFFPFCTKAYSVLTHEALIDANWEKVLAPLLQYKYPQAGPKALEEAHAYAYGGAVTPDMGYYPTGSRMFTQLLHYVRSGDFVEQLLQQARNINEYAFALGVLCHYNADRYGHSIGINTAVPLIYPKMKERYGDTVTWAHDHISHVRTEFSFDVLQTARGIYASTAYQGFIGFKIADTVLEKAFYATYGLHLNQLFKNLPRTISIFRWTVSNLLPFITRSAWSSKKHQIKDSIPAATARSFVYRMRIKNYNKQFGKRERPGLGAYMAAMALKIVPKIGPLRVLKFRHPTREAEKKFVQSFDTASMHFAGIANTLSAKDIVLANIDFDTGNRTAAGEYAPSDMAYAAWLQKLQENGFATTSKAMQHNILRYYTTYTPPKATRKQQEEWKRTSATLAALEKL